MIQVTGSQSQSDRYWETTVRVTVTGNLRLGHLSLRTASRRRRGVTPPLSDLQVRAVPWFGPAWAQGRPGPPYIYL
jgi:hypothetical protein